MLESALPWINMAPRPQLRPHIDIVYALDGDHRSSTNWSMGLCPSYSHTPTDKLVSSILVIREFSCAHLHMVQGIFSP